MANKISLNDVKPNETVIVKGKVHFSRITAPIAGEELKKDQAMSKFPRTRPYTKMVIKEARVVAADPANPTLLEKYAVEHMFTSPKHPEYKRMFQGNNVSSNLPTVAEREPANKGNARQIYPEAELAVDLNVTLVLRVYKSKSFNNHGLTLDTVIVDEPVRYFDANGTKAALAARGINFIPSPPPTDNYVPTAATIADNYTANTDAVDYNETETVSYIDDDPYSTDGIESDDQGILYVQD